MNQCDITDTGLRALTKLSFLSEFKLKKKWHYSKKESTKVTSDGLQALGALTELKTLWLNGMCCKEQHGLKLGFVTKLKRLRELDLDESKITDVGLAGLEGTTSLTTLSLYCWGITVDICGPSPYNNSSSRNYDDSACSEVGPRPIC